MPPPPPLGRSSEENAYHRLRPGALVGRTFAMLPAKVQELVQLLARLPSVGEKTAQRFALFLATREPDTARALGAALADMAAAIVPCSRCGNLAERAADPTTLALCQAALAARRDWRGSAAHGGVARARARRA
jgi:recombination protein RecR